MQRDSIQGETKTSNKRGIKKALPRYLGTKLGRPKLELKLAWDINSNKKQLHKNYQSKKQLREHLDALNTEDSIAVVQKRLKYSTPLLPKSSQTKTTPKPLQALAQTEREAATWGKWVMAT